MIRPYRAAIIYIALVVTLLLAMQLREAGWWF